MPERCLAPLLCSSIMAGFNGLRVLSFESRRAKEIAHLITKSGGIPIVAPSTREVPEGPNNDEAKLIRGILAQEFEGIIFMTGVGARALIEAANSISSGDQFLAALGKTRVVVRGPKPAAVMREFNVPVSLTVPEPNTWREIVSALDANSQALPLKGSRIAVQEHGEPSPELYAVLRERGAEVFPVHVYRWALPEDAGPLRAAIQSLVNREVDLVMFTSSVQFVHAARIADEIGVRAEFLSALNNVVVASIGPTTSETLRRNGVNVDFEPSHPKMGFLVKEAAEKSAELFQAKTQSRAAQK
jgi:uroporphyrinogen-III synthase